MAETANSVVTSVVPDEIPDPIKGKFKFGRAYQISGDILNMYEWSDFYQGYTKTTMKKTKQGSGALAGKVGCFVINKDGTSESIRTGDYWSSNNVVYYTEGNATYKVDLNNLKPDSIPRKIKIN